MLLPTAGRRVLGELVHPCEQSYSQAKSGRGVFLQEHLRGRRHLPRLTMYHFCSFAWEWKLLLDKAPNAMDPTVVACRKL